MEASGDALVEGREDAEAYGPEEAGHGAEGAGDGDVDARSRRRVGDARADSWMQCRLRAMASWWGCRLAKGVRVKPRWVCDGRIADDRGDRSRRAWGAAVDRSGRYA
jgi:hypothetical protein